MAAPKLNMLVRNFATSNVAQAMVKPPIQLFGMEGRYATALYSAASKEKKLEAVEKELVNFQTAMKTDTKLREFVDNPTIARKLKMEAFKAISSKMSFSPATTNLLELLAENGRLKKLNQVINSYRTIMSAHRGEITCEVITAKPLEAGQKSKLEGVLKSFLKSNETLHLTAKVDPNILGGMIVSIGDRYVDMSVASKINKYTDLINTVV